MNCYVQYQLSSILRNYADNCSVEKDIRESITTPEDKVHYCQEMAKAKFEATDAAQVRDILDFCVDEVTVIVIMYN